MKMVIMCMHNAGYNQLRISLKEILTSVHSHIVISGVHLLFRSTYFDVGYSIIHVIYLIEMYLCLSQGLLVIFHLQFRCSTATKRSTVICPVMTAQHRRSCSRVQLILKRSRKLEYQY